MKGTRLVLSVTEVDAKGHKVRNGRGWLTFKQAQIRRMLPKRIVSHFGLGVISICALALAGCISTQVRDDALAEFGRTGRAVQPLLRAPADPSEVSLLKAFDAAIAECEKYGGK